MRTDGHHNTNIAAATVAALSYHCRSCSLGFPGTELRISDRRTGTIRRLADTGYDPVSEDELRCACESKDLTVV